MRSIYLDHAATTPVRPEVREAMAPYLDDIFGNPSSTHRWGRRAAAALEDARERVAHALGARPPEIFFVRGGTESDNLAVLGRAVADREAGRQAVVVHSAIEHKAVLEAASAVGASGGEVREVRVDADGGLDLSALDDLIADEPSVVSVMWVNNEVGSILPMGEVVHRCRARAVAVHSDAVQAVGKIPVSVSGEEAPDLLTMTGHKIYGPKGTGILFARTGVALAPMVHGGGQERGLRPGTQDVAGAVGVATALQLAVTEQASEGERLNGLRTTLETELEESIDDLRIHGREGPRAPHVLNVGIRGASQVGLLAALDLEGIAVSGGSACDSGTPNRSHVLKALYGDETPAWASVRFSLGLSTRSQDLLQAARVTADVVGHLRDLEGALEVGTSS